MSHSVCVMQGEGVFFGVGGIDFYRKQMNEGFNWKVDTMELAWHLTCPTIHGIKHFYSSDVPVVWQTKIWCKFSAMTHKLKVLVSFVQHSSCPYGPLNKVMRFVKVNLTWILYKGFYYRRFVGYTWETLWKGQTKAEKAVFVLEFVNAQWYWNRKILPSNVW